jgi:hypothetical protein
MRITSLLFTTFFVLVSGSLFAQQSPKTFHTNGNSGFVQVCGDSACSVLSVHTDSQVANGATKGFVFYAVAAPDGTSYFGVGDVHINVFSGNGQTNLSLDMNTNSESIINFVCDANGCEMGPGGDIHMSWTATDLYSGQFAGSQTETTRHSQFTKTGSGSFTSAHASGSVLGVTMDSNAAELGTLHDTTILVTRQ